MQTGLMIGIVWIIAGIVVLAWHDALRWVVGIALIVIGVLSLMKGRES